MNRTKIFLIMCIIIMVSVITPASSAVLIVDKWGTGTHKTIPAAITAANAGDTVVVYPGEYTDQVILNKNILLQGSGYEYTVIRTITDPALTMSTGTVRWFTISSSTGDGVKMSGGVLSNCVVSGCAKGGIWYSGGSLAVIMNCVVKDNNFHPSSTSLKPQILSTSDGLSVINTIIWTCPTGEGERDWIFGDGANVSILYCRSSNNSLGIGCISDNPCFISCSDVKLCPTSACIDTGSTVIFDPDGTRSDMGYFGGTDTPIFPVITKLIISVNPDGTVKVQGTAESRY